MRLNRIKFIVAMAEADITAQELSVRSGIARTTISCIKRGKSCRKETAIALARALNVSAEAIIEHQPEPTEGSNPQ